MASALLGSYVLQSHNSKEPASGSVLLQLDAGSTADEIRVHAKATNTLQGVATYADGHLKGMIITTEMMGPAYNMDVERALFEGMSKGISASREGHQLQLRNERDVLIFVTK